MTNRNFIPVLICLSVGLSCLTSPLIAMDDPEWLKIRMIIEAPIELDPLFPRIGFYGEPYTFAKPLVAISSAILIDIMPENLLRAVGGIYGLSGSVDVIRAGLKKQQKDRALRTSLVILEGLSTNPSHYNVVFHQIVGDWQGKNNIENVNENIAAGLFAPQGVRAAGESIAFNALGNLNVNRHDRDMYSPDNGRFYPEAGKDAVSFWLVGAFNGHTVVSYNLMLLSADVKKRFFETIDTAKGIGDKAAQLDFLTKGLRSLEKVIQNRTAITGVIQALENMQLVLIVQKPAEIKRDAAVASDLAILNNNLRSLAIAVKEKSIILTAAQQQAATNELLSEIEARELQAQEDAALAVAMSA